MPDFEHEHQLDDAGRCVICSRVPERAKWAPKLTRDQGDALIWLIDFVMQNPRQPLAGSRWPEDLRGAKEALGAEGFRNPYP